MINNIIIKYLVYMASRIAEEATMWERKESRYRSLEDNVSGARPIAESALATTGHASLRCMPMACDARAALLTGCLTRLLGALSAGGLILRADCFIDITR